MSPLIWGNWRRDLAADISEIWWEIQLKIKTNPCSHTFEAVNESASNFERVFRHFVMNLSEQKLLHINMNVRGRADNSSPPSLVHNKWLNFTSTFSAPALRGLRHSSHKSKLQWDEQACLGGGELVLWEIQPLSSFFSDQKVSNNKGRHNGTSSSNTAT